MKKAISVFVMLCAFAAASAHAQRDYNSNNTPKFFTNWSPAALSMNAVVLPASSATTKSSFVGLAGVQSWTLMYTCTQSASLYINYVADDQTTILSTYQLTTVITAPANYAIYGTQYGIVNNYNNVLTSPKPVLPAFGIEVHFVNNSATPGTCTAAMYLGY